MKVPKMNKGLDISQLYLEKFACSANDDDDVIFVVLNEGSNWNNIILSERLIGNSLVAVLMYNSD